VALAALAGLAALSLAGPARADMITGTMFYTTFSGAERVHKVTYTYDTSGATFALTNNTDIAALPGSDGLVFTSDGFLAVGGQGSTVYRVNPSNGSFTSQSTNGPAAFHMSVAPNGAILAASIPGGPVKFNSTLTNAGTPLTFTGGPDSNVDTIVFDKNGQGWYTDSGSGGFGNFGKINIDFTNNTYSTVRTMSGVPAAHGAAYDPFTDTIILMGDGHISQVDPNGPGTSLLNDFAPGFGGTYDQGAVDGKGHIFAANNDGHLTFIDISGSKNVAAANFISNQFLNSNLDDVAPLVGPGAAPPPPVGAPEPSTMTLLALGSLSLLGYGWRRRKQAA
jgi:hypothetical protein